MYVVKEFKIYFVILTKTTCPFIFFRVDLKNNFSTANSMAGIISKIHNNISNINFIGLAGICLYGCLKGIFFTVAMFIRTQQSKMTTVKHKL